MFAIAAAAISVATSRRGWGGSAWRRRGPSHLWRRAAHLRRARLEGRPVHLWCRTHPAVATAEMRCLRPRCGDLRLWARGLKARTIVAAVEARLELWRCGARLRARHGHLRAPAAAASLRLRLGRHCTWLRLRLRLRAEALGIAPHPMIAAHIRKLGAVGLALRTRDTRRIGLTLRP
ncbi:MAG: hypothetical protein JF595_17710 [Sphingomonadales bacterium]|nr:hypothetical protein [Sphingomonadales bacterium]